MLRCCQHGPAPARTYGPQASEEANSPQLREWFPLPGPAPPAKQLKALDEGRLPRDMQGFAVHTRRTFAVRPAPPAEVRYEGDRLRHVGVVVLK